MDPDFRITSWKVAAAIVFGSAVITFAFASYFSRPEPISDVGEAPSIRIIYPNGGEVFSPGAVVSIQWAAEGLDTVFISLMQGGKDHGLITPDGVPASAGSQLWTVPERIVRDFGEDGYKIFIFTADGLVRDESDDPFMILSK